MTSKQRGIGYGIVTLCVTLSICIKGVKKHIGKYKVPLLLISFCDGDVILSLSIRISVYFTKDAELKGRDTSHARVNPHSLVYFLV